MSFFDFLLKFLEPWKIGAACCLEDVDDPLKLRLLELNVQDVKIGGPSSPVLDLI